MLSDILRSDERGRTRLPWLDSRHSFSFGSWQDPRRDGLGPLLVLNDDEIAAGGGFALHPHRDMEILTWVLDGSLRHRDDLGNEGVLLAGDVQRMSAGTGIRHGEWNASKVEPLRLLQIWILPDRRGLAPSWEQSRLPDDASGLTLLASGVRGEGALFLHQDAKVFAGRTGDADNEGHGRLEHLLGPRRQAWVQVVDGRLRAGETLLERGDAAAFRGGAGPLPLVGDPGASFLLVDVPAPTREAP